MGDGGRPDRLFPVLEVTGDVRVGFGFSGKGSANDERQRIVSVDLSFQGVHETVQAGLFCPQVFQVYGQLRPANHIEGMVDEFQAVIPRTP